MQGRLELENGDIYEGEWREGRKEGRGVYWYSNGDSYNGGWWGNMRHGYGEYKRKGGGVIAGTWQMNKCHNGSTPQRPPTDAQSGASKPNPIDPKHIKCP